MSSRRRTSGMRWPRCASGLAREWPSSSNGREAGPSASPQDDMSIYAFGDYTPVVHETAFVHPQAAVTGNVVIGRDVYIGPGAALRGDWGGIVIEDGCNVQENCVIHMFPGTTVVLEESAHMGHGSIVHGGRIGRNTLIGMNAVIMDDVTIGAECIIGALSFVPA